jgi:hypothetical protein
VTGGTVARRTTNLGARYADFPFGVGDDDTCLVIDRRAEFGVVSGHVSAGFEQPQ